MNDYRILYMSILEMLPLFQKPFNWIFQSELNKKKKVPVFVPIHQRIENKKITFFETFVKILACFR